MRVPITPSAACGDPFEGRVEPAHVLGLAGEVAESKPDEIVLADTIGVGVPTQVRELVGGVAAHGITVGCHFHDTRNTGIANAVAAVESGATVLDASVGGTGGCPFAPKATGNIATEDLVYLLHGMGFETGWIFRRSLRSPAGSRRDSARSCRDRFTRPASSIRPRGKSLSLAPLLEVLQSTVLSYLARLFPR